MQLQLSAPTSKTLRGTVTLTGSKSETNRCLLLQALFPNLRIKNPSNADDAALMVKGLQQASGTVDIHHAGTAMRFLTAYFASQPGKEVLLTGSERMQQRPIGVLVNALQHLGAAIEYEKKQGYPPLKITGKKLIKHKVTLPANMSSQYISALLLIAPSLEKGLEVALTGKITSAPYIRMTLSLLQRIGIETSFKGNHIKVAPKHHVEDLTLVVESDWSSASYFYSMVALAEVGTTLQLSSYKENSLQGDSIVAALYKPFGVTTTFSGNQVTLAKTSQGQRTTVSYDFSNVPDLAQTFAVSCFGLGLGCHLSGLHTLPIKETDRLAALRTELTKLGAKVMTKAESLTLEPHKKRGAEVAIATYNDHRMAMAFAPLALRMPLTISDAGVVSKSYPDFWSDLKTLGFGIEAE